MANRTRKFLDNVPGKYYVDEDCIDCSLCSEIAPEHFRVHIEKGHDYVYRQPTTIIQEQDCLEAMESCPVEAIGNDGDQKEFSNAF